MHVQQERKEMGKTAPFGRKLRVYSKKINITLLFLILSKRKKKKPILVKAK